MIAQFCKLVQVPVQCPVYLSCAKGAIRFSALTLKDYDLPVVSHTGAMLGSILAAAVMLSDHQSDSLRNASNISTYMLSQMGNTFLQYE